MEVIGWLLIGLIAGALARALVPGRDAMGLIGTLVLGLVGSVVGGLIGQAFQGGDQDGIAVAGLLGSIVGAVLVLLIVRMAASRRSGTRRGHAM